MDFDLSKYELQDCASLTVQNAAGDADLIGADGVNPVTIELYGSGSRQYVAAMNRANQRAAARAVQMMRGKVSQAAADEGEQDDIDKLAACTRAINNFPVAPADLYANPKLGYIRRQVSKFLADDANFTRGSPTN